MPNLKSQQKLIEKFNSTYKVGDTIKVRQDNGTIEEWTVSAPASMLGGHTAVIWAEEQRGCYMASRVIF